MKKLRKLGLAVLCIGLVVALASFAGAKPPYDKYAGTTIVANFPSHQQFESIKTLIPEFEKETGIKVEVDWTQYMRMHELQLLEMAKPIGQYDIVALVCMWKTEYVTKGLLTPLSQFLGNPVLYDPSYDLEDIVPAYLAVSGMVGGPKGYLPGLGAAIYAIPWGSETSILAYRKDLFDKYGFTAPENYDDLIKIAEFFKNQVKGVDGLTIRGSSGHQAGHSWLNFASPFGAKVFDENWLPAFQKEPSLEALRYMKKVVDTGPPGIPSYGFEEMINAFLLGRAAMYLDSTAVLGSVNSPQGAQVKGKVAYAVHPWHTNKGARGEVGGFAIGIPNNSKNKEAAWLFLQWLSNKENSKKAARLGTVPFRFSVIQELQAEFPEYEVYMEALKIADPDWRPIIPVWPEVEEQHLGIGINDVLRGAATPEQAMNALVEPVKEIMRRNGYYTWLEN